LTDAELRAAPIPISGTVTASGASLNVSEALNFTAHNLLSAPLSLTTNVLNDYMADGIELHFSTRAPRDISLTTEDGAIVRKIVGDTSLDREIPLNKRYFEGGEQLTLVISQTTSACAVTGKLTVAQGELSLAGNPVVYVERPAVIRDINAFYNIRGQRYIATTGYVPNTLNTTTELIALLKNPAGSGKVLVLDKAEFGATADTRFSRFGGGISTIVGGATPQPIGRTDGGASSSIMELYIGGNGGGSPVRANQITSASGGTLRKVAAIKGYDAYQLNDVKGTTVLQPGQQSYWRVDESPGGGGGTFYTYIDFEWWEVDLAEWNLMVTSMQSRPVY
jgi:hypothetical protein